MYGNNVSVESSFPYQYSPTEVYSMAAPSYGIFSYLYLSEKALSDGKDIVISILAENDFSKVHAHCFIDFENKYWKKTLQELEIPISDLGCHENENYFLKKGIFYQLKDNLKKIAIVSAFYTLTIERYKASKEVSDDGYKKKRISLKYTNNDIRKRWYLDIYWPKILKRIKKLSKKYNKNVTILIIPSREDYTFKIKSKFPSELLDEFYFEKEKILFMENEIKKQGINYVSMNDVLNNMNKNIKYYGSHPYGDGYSAYAKALKQHFNKHKKK